MCIFYSHLSSESTESPAPITNTKEEPAVPAVAKNPKTEPIVPAVDVVDNPIVSVAADPVAVVTPEPTKPPRKRRAKTNVTVTINPRAGATKRKAARAASEAIAAVKRVILIYDKSLFCQRNKKKKIAE